jgi:hypothetical protein
MAPYLFKPGDECLACVFCPLSPEISSRCGFCSAFNNNKVPFFYAWLDIAGKHAQLYKRSDAHGKTEHFVEASEGDSLKVCFTDRRRTATDPFSVFLFVDGT